jgi:hypothetical protein
MNKRIYACYSPSHRPLLERHFLPSIPDGFDVVLRKFDQICASGEYRSTGWKDAVKVKILFILEAIERESEPFVFSDVDVRFYDFRPEHLVHAMLDESGKTLDLRCQNDNQDDVNKTFCAGFMFIRPNPTTSRLFQLTLDAIPEHNSDQEALNKSALPALHSIAASVLPLDKYWNIGPCWNGAKPPIDIIIHHANWIVGVNNKMKQLEDVASTIANSKNIPT